MGSCLFAMAAGLIYGRIAGRDEDVTEIWVFDKAVDSTVINTGAVILTVLLVLFGYNAFTGYSQSIEGYYDYSDDYYSYKPYTTNVIAGEWLPDAVKDRDSLLADSEEMISSDGTELNFRREKNTVIADIDGDYDYIDAPLIYYKGYKAELTDGTGNKIRLNVSGEGHNGICRVYMDGNDKGTLAVSYKGTLLIWISASVSVLTTAYAIRTRYKRNRSARAAPGSLEQTDEAEKENNKYHSNRRNAAPSGKEGHE